MSQTQWTPAQWQPMKWWAWVTINGDDVYVEVDGDSVPAGADMALFSDCAQRLVKFVGTRVFAARLIRIVDSQNSAEHIYQVTGGDSGLKFTLQRSGPVGSVPAGYPGPFPQDSPAAAAKRPDGAEIVAATGAGAEPRYPVELTAAQVQAIHYAIWRLRSYSRDMPETKPLEEWMERPLDDIQASLSQLNRHLEDVSLIREKRRALCRDIRDAEVAPPPTLPIRPGAAVPDSTKDL